MTVTVDVHFQDTTNTGKYLAIVLSNSSAYSVSDAELLITAWPGAYVHNTLFERLPTGESREHWRRNLSVWPLRALTIEPNGKRTFLVKVNSYPDQSLNSAEPELSVMYRRYDSAWTDVARILIPDVLSDSTQARVGRHVSVISQATRLYVNDQLSEAWAMANAAQAALTQLADVEPATRVWVEDNARRIGADVARKLADDNATVHEALAVFEELWAQHNDRGNYESLDFCVQWLIILSERIGDTPGAYRWANAKLSLAKSTGSERDLTATLLNVVIAASNAGLQDEARELLVPYRASIINSNRATREEWALSYLWCVTEFERKAFTPELHKVATAYCEYGENALRSQQMDLRSHFLYQERLGRALMYSSVQLKDECSKTQAAQRARNAARGISLFRSVASAQGFYFGKQSNEYQRGVQNVKWGAYLTKNLIGEAALRLVRNEIVEYLSGEFSDVVGYGVDGAIDLVGGIFG